MKVRFFVSVVLVACFSHLTQAETILPAVDCVIIPSKTVDISAAVPGVISHLHSERSDRVHKGLLLAELDSRVEQANVELSRVRSKMSAEISAEQVNLKYDQLQSRRVQNLKQKNLVSVQNKDEAARLEKVTYWRLKQAKDTLKTRQLELARSLAQLEETKVYSTIEGVIAQVYKAEGEYVEDQPIMRLVQLNPLHVEAVLPMEHYGQVNKNMLAGVYPEIDPDNKLNAKVVIVDPVGDTASGTFGVRLSMDNPGNKIPAGMKCVLKLDSSVPNKKDQSKESHAAAQTTQTSVVDSSTDEKREVTEQVVNQPQTVQPLIDTKLIEEVPHSASAVATEAVQKHSFGPYSGESASTPAETVLSENGYAFVRRVEGSTHVKGYLVLLSKDYQQSKRHLMAEFREAGIRGMKVLPRRSYDGRWSFGAYNGPQMAEARQAQLMLKGIRSDVVARRSGEVRTWLDVAKITASQALAVNEQIKTFYN